MRNRCADRVGVVVRDQEIGVCAIGIEWVVPSQFQFLAGLPPAVDRRYNHRMQWSLNFALSFTFHSRFEDHHRVLDALSVRRWWI